MGVTGYHGLAMGLQETYSTSDPPLPATANPGHCKLHGNPGLGDEASRKGFWGVATMAHMQATVQPIQHFLLGTCLLVCLRSGAGAGGHLGHCYDTPSRMRNTHQG